MLSTLQIAAVMVVAVAMALALAHALEMPGKRRLRRDVYFAVQRIYYPGFTIGGISEPAGLACLLVLCFMTPRGTLAFGLTLVALAGLVGMQGVYWAFIHPVNKVWMQDGDAGELGSGFFGVGRERRAGEGLDWTRLRDRWEYAHAARAVLGFSSFTALLIAAAG